MADGWKVEEGPWEDGVKKGKRGADEFTAKHSRGAEVASRC
jgi:hypothetical protein